MTTQEKLAAAMKLMGEMAEALMVMDRVVTELYPGDVEPDDEHVEEYKAVWRAVMNAREHIVFYDAFVAEPAPRTADGHDEDCPASGVDFVPWGYAGGPNECVHGYAAGVPCERCLCTCGLRNQPAEKNHNINCQLGYYLADGVLSDCTCKETT